MNPLATRTAARRTRGRSSLRTEPEDGRSRSCSVHVSIGRLSESTVSLCGRSDLERHGVTYSQHYRYNVQLEEAVSTVVCFEIPPTAK